MLNSVCFLCSHSRYAQNDSSNIGRHQFWKRNEVYDFRLKKCVFLSNLVCFLDSHSRYAQNNFFNLGPTSSLKKFLRSLSGSCEKWQPISQRKGGFHPPASTRVKKAGIQPFSVSNPCQQPLTQKTRLNDMIKLKEIRY